MIEAKVVHVIEHVAKGIMRTSTACDIWLVEVLDGNAAITIEAINEQGAHAIVEILNKHLCWIREQVNAPAHHNARTVFTSNFAA